MLTRVLTCGFDTGYMFIAVSVFAMSEIISKIIANIIVIIANYALSKLCGFSKEK